VLSSRFLPSILLTLIFVSLLSACSSTDSPPALRIFVAASAYPAMEDLSQAWTEDTGVEVLLNPGSSGTLVRQILAGAPADIFLTAHPRWKTRLEEESRVLESSGLVTNTLVLAIPKGKESAPPISLQDLGDGLGVIGDPSHVPLGQYTKNYFELLGTWSEIEGKPLLASDARSAVALVELGEVDWGIVYRTDAQSSSKVSILETIPPIEGQAVRYSKVLLDSSRPEMEDFYRYLSSLESQEIWKKWGFEFLESSDGVSP
jgi:molybdate transport system substrate-binding protein